MFFDVDIGMEISDLKRLYLDIYVIERKISHKRNFSEKYLKHNEKSIIFFSENISSRVESY
jgi:hypothetical protein